MIVELDAQIFIALFWLVFLIYCVRDCMRPKNYPRGPIFLPFIGSAWAIPVKGTENLVPKWTKKYGNIVGHKFYKEKFVLFCGSEEIVEGLKHPNFQGRYHSKYLWQRTCNQPLGIFFGDDENWSEIRRFTLRYLGAIFTKELETILHNELVQEFKDIGNGEIFNIDEEFIKTPLNVTLRILSGTRRNDNLAQINDMSSKSSKAFTVGRVTGIELVYPIFKDLFNNKVTVEATTAIHNFLKDQFEEHKKSFDPSNIRDYVDAFINESEKELESNGKIINFTYDEFLSCGSDLIQAGNESMGKTIRYILMHVAMNQHIQRSLHREIDQIIGPNRYPVLNDRVSMPYLEATIYEGMRIEPNVPLGVMHRVTKDTNFKGYFLEKDTLIMFALKYYMNNPEKWHRHEEFMPERFLDGDDLKKKLVITFGLGRRSCIAEVFAKKFMFLYFAYFFQKFSIQLPFGYKPSIEPVVGLTNGPKSFKLIITERRVNTRNKEEVVVT